MRSYIAGFLNKTGPFEVPLRDKLNNFAHLLTKAGSSEELYRQSATVSFRSSAQKTYARSQVVFSGRLGPCEKTHLLRRAAEGKICNLRLYRPGPGPSEIAGGRTATVLASARQWAYAWPGCLSKTQPAGLDQQRRTDV